MKKLTCQDLAGPCDFEVTAESFDELGEKAKAHVMEMMKNGDQPHIDAANAMGQLSPEEQQTKMAEFQKKFEEAPEVE